MDLILRCNLLSNSCGATSEMLDAVTSEDGRSGTMTQTTPDGLLKALERAASLSTHWYCRVTRAPHSFFIEYRSGVVRVYQSYFSKYTMAYSVANVRPKSMAAFLRLLEAGMEADNRAQKLELFMAEPHWSSTRVEYRLNLHPADPETMIRNVLSLLTSTASEWQRVRGRTMRELAPSEPRVESSSGTTDPTSLLATEYNVTGDEVPYFFDLTEEEERQAASGTLRTGSRYKSILVLETVWYTLVSYDSQSGKYRFRKG